MLRQTTQNVIPIHRQLGGIIDDIVGTIGNKVQNAALDYASNVQVRFGNQTNGWIPAQNKAGQDLANILAEYIRNKSAGKLTANYINQAIAAIGAVTNGFTQFTRQFTNSGAARGASEIANNANEIIRNMNYDLANLPVSFSNSITSTIQSVPSYVWIGAAFFFLPKLLKGR